MATLKVFVAPACQQVIANWEKIGFKPTLPEQPKNRNMSETWATKVLFDGETRSNGEEKRISGLSQDVVFAKMAKKVHHLR